MHAGDLVNRCFTATGPNRLWVADITYVRTTSGFCYTAFITDVFSVADCGMGDQGHVRTEALLLEALEHALSTAQDRALDQLVHHSDRGSQYVSIRYTEHLGEAGVQASVGSVGDSYDNAMAETVNALHKAELIYARPAWPSVTEVEFATMNAGALVEPRPHPRFLELPNPGRDRERLSSNPREFTSTRIKHGGLLARRRQDLRQSSPECLGAWPCSRPLGAARSATLIPSRHGRGRTLCQEVAPCPRAVG